MAAEKAADLILATRRSSPRWSSTTEFERHVAFAMGRLAAE
jgi:hypothetical protein